jgi:hypothetical protein
MTGPIKLLTLILGFGIIYTPMIVMEMITYTTAAHWVWFGAGMVSLTLYFTIWGIGFAKGWWK